MHVAKLVGPMENTYTAVGSSRRTGMLFSCRTTMDGNIAVALKAHAYVLHTRYGVAGLVILGNPILQSVVVFSPPCKCCMRD